ncbi:predicted protein [Naegleria gruberi]|uniref:Predicted protein n=1 Tax=Naegleria gruberi TaxID=5762 RepID=D2VHB3_NAEGR|nr:uncharacterized protein NAEGRDRAFT_49457 [Naegleria gruberi]EFC43856.1 predicted protein [Naegleria gruberi]|eukprot:XP_002676600.1 predicted protein [Naegleria gruberi strain NEG-M]
MSENLLTVLDYLRMSPNSQSLMCSLFSKVFLLSTDKDADDDDGNNNYKITNLAQDCKQALNEKLGKQVSEDSQFWSELIDDFRKLINDQQDLDHRNENSDFELFPSLTSNDDDSNLAEDEIEMKNESIMRKIPIERRWKIESKLGNCLDNLEQVIEKIENSNHDENSLIEILQDLFNIYEGESEFKHIFRISRCNRIEKPLLFHKIMEECLEIYYCQSDNNQLEKLTRVVNLFKFFNEVFRIRHLDLCSLKKFLLFQVEQFLPITLLFCFSYHYLLRDAVFELLKKLSDFPCLQDGSTLEIKENDLEWFKIIPEKQLINASLTLYVDLTDCNTWMDKLGEETFKTRFLSISYGEAQAIVKEYERWFFGSQTQSEEEEILKGLANRINQVMSEFPNREAFVKLSHRSPKDAAFKVNQYDAMVEEMVKQWSELYSLEVDSSGDRLSLKHEKYQSAITQICAQKCMKVKSGEDFIKLMTISYRSHVDLSVSLGSDAVQHQSNESMPIQIVISFASTVEVMATQLTEHQFAFLVQQVNNTLSELVISSETSKNQMKIHVSQNTSDYDQLNLDLLQFVKSETKLHPIVEAVKLYNFEGYGNGFVTPKENVRPFILITTRPIFDTYYICDFGASSVVCPILLSQVPTFETGQVKKIAAKYPDTPIFSETFSSPGVPVILISLVNSFRLENSTRVFDWIHYLDFSTTTFSWFLKESTDSIDGAIAFILEGQVEKKIVARDVETANLDTINTINNTEVKHVYNEISQLYPGIMNISCNVMLGVNSATRRNAIFRLCTSSNIDWLGLINKDITFMRLYIENLNELFGNLNDVSNTLTELFTTLQSWSNKSGSFMGNIENQCITFSWNSSFDCKDHSKKAADQTRQLIERTKKINSKVNLRFSMLTEKCSVGNIGTEKMKNFTIFGNYNANLDRMIQQAIKLNIPNLVSESVYKENAQSFEFRFVCEKELVKDTDSFFSLSDKIKSKECDLFEMGNQLKVQMDGTEDTPAMINQQP